MEVAHESLCQKRIDSEKALEERRIEKDALRKVCPYIDCNSLEAKSICKEDCIGSKYDRLVRWEPFISCSKRNSVEMLFIWWLKINVSENSSEAGLWYHTPDVGEDLVIKHKLNSTVTFCKVIPPVNSSEYYLHLENPMNPRYPDMLRYKRNLIDKTKISSIKGSLREELHFITYFYLFSIENRQVLLTMVDNNTCQLVVKNIQSRYNGEWKFSIETIIDSMRKLKTHLHNVKILPIGKE